MRRNDEIKEDLETCGFPKASTMPKLEPGNTKAPQLIDEMRERLIAEERGKLYASQDTNTGKIYLITNPITWEAYTDDKGRSWRRRPTAIPLSEYRGPQPQQPMSFTAAAARQKGLEF